jgi:hypothetical protein
MKDSIMERKKERVAAIPDGNGTHGNVIMNICVPCPYVRVSDSTSEDIWTSVTGRIIEFGSIGFL